MDNDTRQAMAAAAARVRAAYAAGVPLFPRAALAQLAAVLDAGGGAVRAGREPAAVTLAGLDGRRVRQATAVGAVTATDHASIELVNVRPRIEYWPVERLVAGDTDTGNDGDKKWHARRFDADRACLALRLGHETEARGVAADGTVVQGPTVAAVAAVLARLAAGLPAPGPRAASDPAALAAWFAGQRAAWEASTACVQLRATLAAAWPEGVAARTVVAFACGTMEGEGRLRERAAAHHALALTMADALAHAQARPVRCVAQDPAYTAADRAVLAAAGVAVVDDPHGFLAVDEAAVVVAIAPALPVAQVVADLARPAAMLWRRVPATDPGPDPLFAVGGADDPPAARVRALVHGGYTAHAFAGDARLFGTVDGLALYVRAKKF